MGPGGVGGSGSSGGSGGGDNAGNGGTTIPNGPGMVVNGDTTTTITLDSFMVPAGSEAFKCQTFTNPFAGNDQNVSEWEVHMTPGSHHTFLFLDGTNANGPLTDCSGLTFQTVLWSSQTPDNDFKYPPGVAMLVPGSSGIKIIAHYLNATTQPIMANVEYIAHHVDPSVVQQHAGTLFINNALINIPSDGAQHTASQTCPIGKDMNLMFAFNHMHKHATNFTLDLSSGFGAAPERLYQTTLWNDPPGVDWTPPKVIHAGASITTTCTYVNNTGSTLTFGESAATNEMCILSGQYYPVVQQSQQTQSCLL